jgi:hypothetical protein
MALDTNFNVNPYYDDFEENKKYLKLLFKPGQAVQSRELTQIQSLLQNQIERFGNHIFQNGSVVSGGQFFLQDATYLKLDTTYNGVDVNVNEFDSVTILSIDETKRAEVIKVFDSDFGTGDPKTLMVKQLYGADFVPGETIKTSGVAPAFSNIATSGVGTGQIFSVNEGIFFYDGFFIQNDPQTIATSKYSSLTANARIGFEITESIVTNNSDTSLLDPAQNASNYQAPGSDRYKVNLVLSARSLESEDDTQFIELSRVENGISITGNRYPIYSVLEETLARRTYDESGNYTVKPFKISLDTNTSNTAQTIVTLSPGKAYVYGFEFETNGPTRLIIDKPRTSANVANKRVPADYGNFVYVTNQRGSFPINTLQTVDLHCVTVSSINNTSTGTISNTKIGTARVSSFVFDSASNTSNGYSYTYKNFLFDVDVGSITGNVNGGSSNTTHVVLNGTEYSKINGAYTGAKFRISSGDGADDVVRTIIDYVGANSQVTLSSPLSIAPNGQSLFSIDFEFKDLESIANHSSTTLVVGADISERSKDSATVYNDVIFTDAALEPLIFKLGENYITQNTISDMSFSYKRLYSGQSFNASESPALTVGTGEDIASATSTSGKAENYQITVTTVGTSPYAVGQIIPADKFSVDSGTNRITVTSGNNMVANIVATIDVSTTSKKVKTYVTGNTQIQTVAGADVYGNSSVISFAANGQCHIAANAVNKIPGEAQSLFVSDVIEIVSVLDFQGNVVTQANASFASNITSSYVLDNGQRDSYYDHSTMKLKTGVNSPVGPLVAIYNRFTSSGSGFFTVDSYSGILYENIPTYSSTKNNQQFTLRDCIDFRPVRSDAITSSGDTVFFNVDSSTTGPKIPENGSDIVLDYSYFLPRIDKVVLDKTKQFQIIKGIPNLVPQEPNDSTTGMTLFVLGYEPYGASTKGISVGQINHRRYTMRDIGSIEKRVENLEYYTSLSLLEQETLTKQDLTILDSQNLPRFKNGIIVDSFKGHSVADVSNADYRAAIDPNKKELRPSFNLSVHNLKFDASNSSNYLQTGQIITANASQVSFIDQPKASRSLNVNPFNVINFLGKIKLTPPSDIWVDVEQQPDVLVNLEGDRDAWDLVLNAVGVTPFDIEWDSWSTTWTGIPTTATQTSSTTVRGRPGRGLRQTTTTTTTATTTQDVGQTRTGIATSVVPGTITQSIGDRVVDVSIVPFMRSINVLFVGTDFKPNTVLYPFFDNTSVENFVGDRVNKFILKNNDIRFNTNLSNPEVVDIRNKDTNTSNGTALVVHTSNNIVYVTNMVANTPLGNIANTQLVGSQTGLTYDVQSYEHNGGAVKGATVNTLTLTLDAGEADNQSTYVNSTIFITQGVGAGQSKTITSYNTSTRVATVNSNWTTTPVTDQSFYAIGRPTTDAAGAVVGLFTIPTGTFRVGEKLFRLTNTPTGDIPSSSTNGDASFFAQGLLNTTEETIISTFAPTIQRTSVSEDRVIQNISTSTSISTTTRWIDPLAETFLISPQQYPEGLMLSKIRICFKTKDDVIPVTLQVRPTVNGFPSSSVVYPFSTVTLNPDKVKVSDIPNMDDANTYTDFVFDSPIYMQPGEHSFVLLANSNKYEAYIAEIGKLDIVENRQISEQPYGGSLFLSQNGSTWTADQNADLMFRLFRYEYSTDSVTSQFLVDYPSSNTKFDALQIITSDVVLAETSLSHQFISELSTGGFTGTNPINSGINYEIDDGSVTRVLNPASGNSTFALQTLMATSNPQISPMIDVTRTGLIAWENRINNLGLANSDIVISNTGSGYANSADVTVTISGGSGSGATAVANVVLGTIDAVYITNSGSGYTSSPTITITPGSGGGIDANVRYLGETEKTGGNAIARYITRRVTLSDGFDSGDLRVYMTANKRPGTNIHVYYKVLSSSDPALFEDKSWQLMTQVGNANFASLNAEDYRELLFAPVTNGVLDNQISYVSGNTVFTTFRTFAIKVVMSSEQTGVVPKIRDLRVIALPAA